MVKPIEIDPAEFHTDEVKFRVRVQVEPIDHRFYIVIPPFIEIGHE